MNIETLRALAAAATPGPWASGSWEDDRERTIATVCQVEGHVVGVPCGSVENVRYGYKCHAPGEDDAAYIAAFSPKTALKLLAMAAEYEAWIDYYHRGSGDYADFLRSRLTALDDGRTGG